MKKKLIPLDDVLRSAGICLSNPVDVDIALSELEAVHLERAKIVAGLDAIARRMGWKDHVVLEKHLKKLAKNNNITEDQAFEKFFPDIMREKPYGEDFYDGDESYADDK